MVYYPEGVCSSLEHKFETVDDIKAAIRSGDVFEGRVLMCDNEHNLHINLGVMMGVIPYKEGAVGIADGTVRDIALISKVNKLVCFRVVGFHKNEDGRRVAVLSRRSVQQSCIDEYISRLVVGDVITAKVTHLEKFGAFIDIGAGINSLIPIDMLSVSRISHPRERLSQNQQIRCVLRKIEENKLTFSLKELLGTWEENASLFSAGQTVMGIVRSIESYGVFVELMPNLAGLSEGYDDVLVGQQVSVFIKSIIPEKMKVKLVIVSTFDAPSVVEEPEYFITRSHIDHWDYSPYGARKDISTSFDY